MNRITPMIVLLFLSTLSATAAEDEALEECGPLQLNSSPEEPFVEGIWSFSLKDAQQFIAAVHQQAGHIFGSAKSENPACNALLIGEIQGRNLDLIITYLNGSSLASISLSGTAEDEALQGTYTWSDDLGRADSGHFSAVLISRNHSDYRPLDIAAPADEKAELQAPEQDYRKRVRDVHSLAGTVPETLGVGTLGPVGFGGMGVGGGTGLG